jgi:hypothetical protein
VYSEKIPDDGQRNCPKHVEFHSKNKFEESVHLVGFTVGKDANEFLFLLNRYQSYISTALDADSQINHRARSQGYSDSYTIKVEWYVGYRKQNSDNINNAWRATC